MTTPVGHGSSSSATLSSAPPALLPKSTEANQTILNALELKRQLLKNTQDKTFNIYMGMAGDNYTTYQRILKTHFEFVVKDVTEELNITEIGALKDAVCDVVSQLYFDAKITLKRSDIENRVVTRSMIANGLARAPRLLKIPTSGTATSTTCVIL